MKKRKSKQINKTVKSRTENLPENISEFSPEFSAKYSRRGFFFFLAIFFCMFIFESKRFSDYFERQSSEVSSLERGTVPVYKFLAKSIEEAGIYSGISALMQSIGEMNDTLASDFVFDVSPKAKPFFFYTENKISETFEDGERASQFSDYISFILDKATGKSPEVRENDKKTFQILALRSAEIQFLQQKQNEEKFAKENNEDYQAFDFSALEIAKNYVSFVKQNVKELQGIGLGFLHTILPERFSPSITSFGDFKKEEILPSTAQKKENVASITIPLAKENKESKESIVLEKIEESLKTEDSTESIASDDILITENIADYEYKNKAEKFPHIPPAEIAYDILKSQRNFYNPAFLQNEQGDLEKKALAIYQTNMPDFGIRTPVLLVGDSMMMEGLGPSLQSLLHKDSALEVTRVGRYSSGLTRPDFFDWPKNLTELIQKHSPELIIISLGANDTQDIVTENKRHLIDSKTWGDAYRKRSFDFISQFALDPIKKQSTVSEYAQAKMEINAQTEKEVSEQAQSPQSSISNVYPATSLDTKQFIWVSLPVMFFENYSRRTRLISKIQEEVSDHFGNVHFLNIEHLLTDDTGIYTAFMRGKDGKSERLRRQDDIHVTAFGGDILADYVLPHVQKSVDILRLQHFAKENLPVNKSPDNSDESLKPNPNMDDGSKNILEKLAVPVTGFANLVEITSKARNKKVEYIIYLPRPQQNNSNNADDANDANDASKASFTKNEQDINPLFPEMIKKNMSSTGNDHNNEERFPVLYLLHGAYTDDCKSFNSAMGKQLQAIADEKRIIIVSPYGESFGWYLDAPLNTLNSEGSTRNISEKVATNQIETFIIKELIPHIDTLYPTNKKRGISGISMGGHGAFLLSLKYPKMFLTMASFSGVMDIRAHKKAWGLADLLGDYENNSSLWDKHSVLFAIENNRKNTFPKQIILRTGLSDFFVLNENRQAKDALAAREISFDYEEGDGEHDWAFWVREIPSVLRKQADFLRKD